MKNEGVPGDQASPAPDAGSIRVFGGVGFDSATGPVSVGGPGQKRLLALFVLRAHSVVTNDWLSEHLWSDKDRPAKVAPAIRTYAYRLRQAFPEGAQDWIQTETGGYRFEPPPNALEHERFASLRAAATRARGRGDAAAAHALLTEALDLWRGDPFVELAELTVAASEIERLNLDRLETLEERWEAALDIGRHTQIVGELAVFTKEHKLRDRATRQHALALYRCGRTPEALRELSEYRRLLGDAGLDPAPALLELERAMLDNDPALDTSNPGRPLRGYQLFDQIGQGAFSVVWRGLQPSVDREVAIKQIRSELASQPEFIRRFEAEAHLIARIEHPHIVPLIDYWRDPDSAYLVMRYMRGGTLERRLDDAELSLEDTIQIARQVGSGLSAAHERGVIHRDVKTANILFDERGNAYLADFGIALERSATGGPEESISVGSPVYAAPEQLKRLVAGPQADVFSLGVVLWECLAGTLPWAQSESAEELLDHQLNTPYPPLANVRADLPSGVSAVIEKATAKAPEDRWPTVAELVDALASAADDSSAQTPDDPAKSEGAINPYKGLEAFDDVDAENFFGRDRLVAEMIDHLSDTSSPDARALLTVGPSGSGKSSIVRAGLIPAIRTGSVPGSDQWFVSSMVPGADPYEALETALLRVAVNPPTSLLDMLIDGPRGVVRGLRRCVPDDGTTVLLLIDQFEELFSSGDTKRTDQFLTALAVAVNEPTSPLRLVATLRADHYDRPLAHREFAPILKRSAVDITPLAADELEHAIAGPAQRQGVEFEPGLVARIAAESHGRASSLPLMQYALSELFDRRHQGQLTAAAYDEIGGLSGALASRAESIYGEATNDEQEAIRRLFGRLSSPGSSDLRRRVAVGDVSQTVAGAAAVERFGAARLVTFDRDSQTREPTVEVAHEALFREWPRLAQWLAEDRDLLRVVDTTAVAAQTWHEGGRQDTDLIRGARLEAALDVERTAPDRLNQLDRQFVDAASAAAEDARMAEQKRVKRLVRLVAAVGIGLVIAVIAGVIAFTQQRRANEQADEAEASAADAQQQTVLAREATNDAELATLAARSAAQSVTNPEVSLLLALEAHRRDSTPETEQVVLNALGSSQSPKRLAQYPNFYGDCLVWLEERPARSQWFTTIDGRFVSRQVTTGEATDHGPLPDVSDQCMYWLGSADGDYRAARTYRDDSTDWWFASWDGEWTKRTFDRIWQASGGAGAISVVVSDSDPETRTLDFALLDLQTGDLVGDPVRYAPAGFPTEPVWTGSSFAISIDTSPDGSGNSGLIAFLDATTGEPQFETVMPAVVTRMAFDQATNELFAVVHPGTVVRVDVATGTIVGEFDVGFPQLQDLAIRPDGTLLILAEAGAEWRDRETGTVVRQKDYAGFTWSRILPDGTVVADDQMTPEVSLLELEGSMLAKRTLSISQFGTALIHDGFAAVTTFLPDSQVVESVDLATGDRTITEVRTADGEPFVAWLAFHTPEGVWAIGPDNIWVRWKDNREVERVDVGGELLLVSGDFDRSANLWRAETGEVSLSLVSNEPGNARVLFTVDAEHGSSMGTTQDGGMFLIAPNGLFQAFDADGSLTGLFSTPAENPGANAIDPATGTIAVATQGASSGVVIIDANQSESRVPPSSGNPRKCARPT